MSERAEPQGGAKLLIDLGPLLVFFLVNFLAPVPSFMKIFVATGAFMIAMVVAMLFSAIRYHRISPLLWFSGIMVVVLGGLTIWLHDETFIKMKPTVYYALVAGLLAFGLRPTGRSCSACSARPIRDSTRPAGTSSPATGRYSSRSWQC